MVEREERQCGGWHYFYTAVGDAMAVLNSSVNFVVYVLASRRFRRGLVAALGCGRATQRLETACSGGVYRSSSLERGLETTEPPTVTTVPSLSSRWRLAARHRQSVI